MSDSTRLQLPLIAAAQAQKHVTHNEAIMRLDGLCQMTAISYTTSAQPGSPSDGDLYLLPAGKTGDDWGGYSDHAVAHYYDGIWHQYHPSAGWLCFVQDAGLLCYYNGSSWAVVSIASDTKPAFFAYLSSDLTGKTGDGTDYSIPWDSELFDQGSAFNTSTGLFTAPVAGVYQFNYTVFCSGVASDNAQIYARLVGTSGEPAGVNFGSGARDSGNYLIVAGAAILKLSASDTAKVNVYSSGHASKNIGITSSSGAQIYSHFSGALIA